MSTTANQEAAPPAPPAEPPAPPAHAAPTPQKAPTRGRPLPPWRVLLHKDDIHDMRYVVRTLIELANLAPPQAKKVMFTAHMKGVALVLVTHRERAELFKDQFASKGLIATIEPAES